MNQVYQNSNYIIFKTDCEYIVQNINRKDFCHSHIKNYKTCIWVIDLLLKKRCPYNIPKYLLISLIRLTDDEIYKNKLEHILEKKNNPKKIYYNSNKGLRKK